MNFQPIDASRAIHRRMLSLGFGAGSFSARDTPVMVSLGDGPFDIRGITVFVPRESLQMEADFTPVRLEPGSREFRSEVKLSAEGVMLQAAAGTLSISPDGLRVDIALKH